MKNVLPLIYSGDNQAIQRNQFDVEKKKVAVADTSIPEPSAHHKPDSGKNASPGSDKTTGRR